MDVLFNGNLLLTTKSPILEELSLLQTYQPKIDTGTLQLDLLQVEGVGHDVQYLNPFNSTSRRLRLSPPELLNTDEFIGEDSLHFCMLSSQNEYELINDVEQVANVSNNNDDGEIVPSTPPLEPFVENTGEDDHSPMPHPPPPEEPPPPRKMSRKQNLAKVLRNEQSYDDAQPHPPPPSPPPKRTRRKQDLTQVRQEDSSSSGTEPTTPKKKKLYECDPDDPLISKTRRNKILRARKMKKFHTINKEKAKKYDTLLPLYNKTVEENTKLKEELAQREAKYLQLVQEMNEKEMNETTTSLTTSSNIIILRRRRSE